MLMMPVRILPAHEIGGTLQRNSFRFFLVSLYPVQHKKNNSFFFFSPVKLCCCFSFQRDCFLPPCDFFAETLLTLSLFFRLACYRTTAAAPNAHNGEIRDLLMVTAQYDTTTFRWCSRSLTPAPHNLPTANEKDCIFAFATQLPCCLLPSSLKLTAALFA